VTTSPDFAFTLTVTGPFAGASKVKKAVAIKSAFMESMDLCP
jgi:hypothetical protein